MSDPSVAQQVKAEAAKSLLERMAEKTKLVRFFRYNASAKHGVPIDNDDISISVPTEQPAPQEQATPPQKTEPVVVEKPVIVEKEKAVIVEKLAEDKDKMKGILQTLVAVAALGAAVWGGSKLVDKNATPTDNTQTESPLQYLEDIGEHLP